MLLDVLVAGGAGAGRVCVYSCDGAGAACEHGGGIGGATSETFRREATVRGGRGACGASMGQNRLHSH